jgi:hypothetical protein
MCPQPDHTPRHRHIALVKHLRSPSFLLWDDSSTGTCFDPEITATERYRDLGLRIRHGRVQTPERLYVPDQQTPHARKMHG